MQWQSIINKWQKTHNENKEVIVITDDNMDHNNTNFNNTITWTGDLFHQFGMQRVSSKPHLNQ